MNVWLVLGADLSNDPCDNVMGVFTSEEKAREYIDAEGEKRSRVLSWWDIESMTLDEPESWTHTRR